MDQSNVPSYDITVRDVEYLSHDTTPLLARIIQPDGPGPFPLLVDVHGGAWTTNDRFYRNAIKEQLARLGVVVVIIDFRMPPECTYPASLADVNYALRWAKAHADELCSRPDWVGFIGDSSGGHQAVLSAMRPHDPRYGVIPSPEEWGTVDATASCVIAWWPVISPLNRYRYAKQMLSEGKLKRMTDLVIPGHEQFWLTEDAMQEGDPICILERGEPAVLPPVLCVQGSADIAHPFEQLDRFVDLYRRAGGAVDLEIVPLEPGQNLGALLDACPTGDIAQRVLSRVLGVTRVAMGA